MVEEVRIQMTSITIQPKKGGPVTYTVPVGAVTLKKGVTSPYNDGERATVILKRNPDGTFSVSRVLVFRKPGKP